MSRKKPDYPNIKCEVCGIGFKPASTLQRFCPACGKEQDRLRKQRWYKAHNPNAYQEKEKTRSVMPRVFLYLPLTTFRI